MHLGQHHGQHLGQHLGGLGSTVVVSSLLVELSAAVVEADVLLADVEVADELSAAVVEADVLLADVEVA